MSNKTPRRRPSAAVSTPMAVPSGASTTGAGVAGAPPAAGLPAKVQLLLDATRLRAQSFSLAEVVTIWQKAVGAAHDAALTGFTSDNAVRLAYDAGHAAALALLAAHGLRPGGGHGHHEVAFAGAAGLGGACIGRYRP